MNKIREQAYDVPDWIEHETADNLFIRIRGMFYQDIYKDDYDEPLYKYISNLDQDDIDRIFYKNNFMEFIRRHEIMRRKFNNLFEEVHNYEHVDTVDEIPLSFNGKFTGTDKEIVKEYNSFVNHETFMDPNSPPDNLIDDLNELKDIVMKCVYMPFMSVDRIHRLKYFRRRTVCIVDTDSNILAVDLLVNFFRDEIMEDTYGRNDETNAFIIINTMAYFITAAVSDTLFEYGKYSNIPEEHRFRFGMKNEFLFTKLVIGKKKKRYISAIKLREGNLLEPYKADCKGYDYMKSATSDLAKKRFDSIVKNRILETKVPDISGILNDLIDFENDIRQSLRDGELTFLPLGSFKELTAYKDPYSQQGVRGGLAWNALYPENQISAPSKVSILKLNIFEPEDCADLARTNPDIYNTIMSQIFNSPISKIADKGLQVLSIPANAKIPEWCFPYIDIDTVVNNILGQFKGVLDTFGIECPEVGKSTKGRKTRKFSNTMRF